MPNDDYEDANTCGSCGERIEDCDEMRNER